MKVLGWILIVASIVLVFVGLGASQYTVGPVEYLPTGTVTMMQLSVKKGLLYILSGVAGAIIGSAFLIVSAIYDTRSDLTLIRVEDALTHRDDEESA
jgi:uncharacterized membrane protein YciS (DUF1049 family)